MVPLQEILIYSLTMSFVIAVIYRFAIDQAAVRKIKSEMNFFNQKIKKAQKDGNTADVKKFSSELMRVSKKNFQLTMKPMLFSMLMFFVLFSWLNRIYGTTIIGQLPFTLPIIGKDLIWFWWYIIITLPFTIVFRKMLGVE